MSARSPATGSVAWKRTLHLRSRLIVPVALLLCGCASALSPSEMMRDTLRVALAHFTNNPLSWLPFDYADRCRMERHGVRSPGLVDVVLYPTLGCPARIESGVITTVLRRRPGRNWSFWLVPREAFPDRLYHPFILPTPPLDADWGRDLGHRLEGTVLALKRVLGSMRQPTPREHRLIAHVLPLLDKLETATANTGREADRRMEELLASIASVGSDLDLVMSAHVRELAKATNELKVGSFTLRTTPGGVPVIAVCSTMQDLCARYAAYVRKRHRILDGQEEIDNRYRFVSDEQLQLVRDASRADLDNQIAALREQARTTSMNKSVCIKLDAKSPDTEPVDHPHARTGDALDREAKGETAVEQHFLDTGELIALRHSEGDRPNGHEEIAIITTLTVAGAVTNNLYALVIREGEDLVDVQFNSVFSSSTAPDALKWVFAADMQWGQRRSVVEASLRFVQKMNAMRLLPLSERPEFIILGGDIVDCQYGSAASTWKKIFSGGDDYARDYMQSWVVLAGLRVPVYVLPGNHDGYRFPRLLGGDPSADGLLLFESVFGPRYHSFVWGSRKFICLNSYDLPARHRTAESSIGASTIFETVSDKLNRLNWGGGMGWDQAIWLEAQLAHSAVDGQTVVLFLHHDPRGTYPALKPSAARYWTVQRHIPITLGAPNALEPDLTRNALGEMITIWAAELRIAKALQPKEGFNIPNELRPAALVCERPPGFEDTEEIHAGHYSPLRRAESRIRSDVWFDTFTGLPPEARGHPGWSRYQEGWHMSFSYTADFEGWERLRFERELVSPLALLYVIANSTVEAIFKGHDNRFCRRHIKPGQSIFGGGDDVQLRRYGGREALELLVLPTKVRGALRPPLDVYHVADVADADTDGHGYFLVAVRGSALEVQIREHY